MRKFKLGKNLKAKKQILNYLPVLRDDPNLDFEPEMEHYVSNKIVCNYVLTKNIK